MDWERWTPLLLFAATTVGGFLWWAVRRAIKNFDDLNEALYAPTGVVALVRSDVARTNARFDAYMPREEIEMISSKLAESLERMRVESVAREARLLDAINGVARSNIEESRITRREIGETNARIDRIRDNAPHP